MLVKIKRIYSHNSRRGAFANTHRTFEANSLRRRFKERASRGGVTRARERSGLGAGKGGPRYQTASRRFTRNYREGFARRHSIQSLKRPTARRCRRMPEGGNNLHVSRIIRGREHARTKPETRTAEMHRGRDDVGCLL